MTYIAHGKEVDSRPSLRYITLLRDGARSHGLPEHYIRVLEDREAAQ
jgi:gamma-glutamylcyclotransferase